MLRSAQLQCHPSRYAPSGYPQMDTMLTTTATCQAAQAFSFGSAPAPPVQLGAGQVYNHSPCSIYSQPSPHNDTWMTGLSMRCSTSSPLDGTNANFTAQPTIAAPSCSLGPMETPWARYTYVPQPEICSQRAWTEEEDQVRPPIAR